MARLHLAWFGDDFKAQVTATSVAAVNDVTAAAVPVAQGLVHVKTGLLQSRITHEPARVEAGQVVGAFGVFDDPGYAWLQEVLPEPRGKAYVRPAGDQAVQQLPDALRRHQP